MVAGVEFGALIRCREDLVIADSGNDFNSVRLSLVSGATPDRTVLSDLCAADRRDPPSPLIAIDSFGACPDF